MGAEYFDVPIDLLSIPAVSDLGELEGPAGIIVLLALMCEASGRDTGEVSASVAEIAQRAHVTVSEALQAISTASSHGLLVELRYSDARIEARLSPRIFRVRKRRRISERVKRAVLSRDGSICQLCGERITAGEEVHLDHIIPWSKGGPDTIENLQVAHGFCNRSKKDRV